MTGPTSGVRRSDWALGVGLLLLGQSILVALGPLSRVGSADATTGPGGLVLLAPDSERYLLQASSWSAVFDAPWTRWGYLLLIRVASAIGDPGPSVVALQALAMTIAGVVVMRTVRDIAGPAAGLVAAAILLVNPMTAQWVRFILTESIFYSLAIGVVAVAARTGREGRARWVLIMLAVAAITFRPTGPLLAGSALTLALARPLRARRGVAAMFLIWASVAIALGLGTAATGPPAEGTFDAQLRAGVVIEGTEEVRTTIGMPPSDRQGVIGYAADHPVATARLFLARVLTEVAQVRRHYPPLVNIAVGTAVAGLALLASIGLLVPRGAALRAPTLLVALPLMAIVGATFAVPEGRYGWAGLVALAPAAGIGAAAIIEATRRGQPTARSDR